LTSAKRIARLIRRSCGALEGKFITTKLQKPAPQREWFGAKNLPETRSGVVIGPCDRALGCEARADNREALYTLCFARVHTPNRMRMTQSPRRVQHELVLHKAGTFHTTPARR